tara:strand:- start:3594 stop:4424 length:831 start_codon:yes stop_codon:yes gene_type:complete
MNKEVNEKEETKRENLRYRKLELYFWMVFPAIILFKPFYENLNYGISKEFFLDYYYLFLVVILFVFFPVLFKLIFRELPIEFIRNQFKNSTETRSIDNVKEKEKKSGIDNVLLEYIEESKTISEKIYSRSGAYLFVGCLIAFSGIAIFYSPIFGQTNVDFDNNWQTNLLTFLPRFGALFFIEFIAFFFLKQYRIMVAEYKYYEKIKRHRQNNYSITKLIQENKDDEKALELMMKNMTILNQTDSNDLIREVEIEKINQKEYDLAGKLKEIIAIAKR